MHKLKVGLIVDSVQVSRQVFNLVTQCNDASSYTVSHIIVYDFNSQVTFKKRVRKLFSSRQKFVRFLEGKFFSLILLIDNFLLGRSGYAGYGTSHDLSQETSLTKLTLHPFVSPSGFVYTFPEKDIQMLREEQFDVLIRCGSGILKGPILDCPRFGILSFHHGDNAFYRGGPAGFWETYHGCPETGFIIQRLTEELDGGIVLQKGTFQTQWYYKLNQAFVLSRANSHLHYELEKIASARSKDIGEGITGPYYNPLYSIPGFGVSIRYFCTIVYRISCKVMNRILGLRVYWGIALGKGSVESAALWKARRIAHPKNVFIADPFLIKHDGTTFLLCEELSYKTQKGVIAAYKVTPNRHVEYIGPVLEEPFHLSFPFVFTYGDKLYMIPECYQSKQVRLYESVHFPTEWKLKKVIFENISAADPLIFKNGDLWWLFINIDPTGDGYHSSELHAFYSTDPIDGSWMPHTGNPIVFSSNGARNGGLLLRQNGTYLRIGQNQGIENYGRSLNMYEIQCLTPEQYSEKLLHTVEPNFFPKLTGTHQISAVDDLYAIDFKYNKFFKYR